MYYSNNDELLNNIAINLISDSVNKSGLGAVKIK